MENKKQTKKLTKKEKTDAIVKHVKNRLYFMRKEDLRETLKEIFDVEPKKNAKNIELINEIKKNCKNRKTCYMKIYEMWKDEYFGASTFLVEDTLNITKYKRQQLEKYYILSIARLYNIRNYGKYITVREYDFDDFLDLIGADIDAILKEERRKERGMR